MYKPSSRDISCVLNMIESIDKIQSYSRNFKNADEFYENSKSFDASMMNFVVIGEMAQKLSSDFLSETENDIDWFNVKGFRNIIAHNYFGIDAEEVWQIIHSSLIGLRENLEKITR